MTDEFKILSGASDEPFPSPELDIGNVVKLKASSLGDDEFGCGVIVNHVSRNFRGIPKVAINRFSTDGRFDVSEVGLPIQSDHVASELILLQVAAWLGTHRNGEFVHGSDILCDGEGLDLYPLCPGCRDVEQHPFAEDRETVCPQCGGWGHEKRMRRLKDFGVT